MNSHDQATVRFEPRIYTDERGPEKVLFQSLLLVVFVRVLPRVSAAKFLNFPALHRDPATARVIQSARLHH